MKAERRKRECE